MKKQFKLLLAIFAISIVCLALFACTPIDTAVTHKVEFAYNGIATQTVIDGEKAVEPKVNLTDEEITWYTDEACNQAYDFTKPVTTDLKLYPKKERTVFTVTFTGDGVNIPSIKVRKGEKLYAPEVAPKEGHKAVWYNGETAYVFGGEVNSDLTLSLTYSANTYKVTFYNYDGEYLAEVDVKYGTSMNPTLMPTHAYPDFYTFKGWDRDLSFVKGDMDVFAEYDYRALPDEIFKYTLLEDGTFGIELKSHEDLSADYSSYNFTGNYGIPEEYHGIPVTRLMPKAMYTYYAQESFGNIEKIFVPSSVKKISSLAFWNNRSAQIILAEGVQEIEACAFMSYGYYNGNFNALYLPSTLTAIQEFAFEDIFEGSEGIIILANGETYIQDEQGDIYTADGKTLIWVKDADQKTSYTFKSSVKNIYPNLFASCYDLEEVIFEGDIDALPSGLFYYCFSLTNVIFNGTVKEILGFEADYGENIRQLEADLDEYGIGLYMPAFGNCFALENFTLPQGLKHIGDHAFREMQLSTINIGADVEYIGEGAFVCTSMPIIEKIYVDENNTHFRALKDNCGLVEIGGGIDGGDRMIIYASANEAVTSLSKEDLKGITSFDSFCFGELKHLVSLELPDGVKVIPKAFINYTIESSLETISLPSTVTKIENSTHFEWGASRMSGYTTISSGSLNTIIWRDGCNVSYFPEGSFVGNFEIFTLPKSITKVDKLFARNGATLGSICYAVEDGNKNFISIDGNLYQKLDGKNLKLIAGKTDANYTEFNPQDVLDRGYIITEIGANAFAANRSLTKIVIPEGVVTIEEEAFYSCLNVKEIEIAASVRKIGGMAFYGMVIGSSNGTGLSKVKFLGTEPPEMEITLSHRIFDCLQRDPVNRLPKYVPVPGMKVYVPDEAFDAYVEAFYNYGGVEYAELITKASENNDA